MGFPNETRGLRIADTGFADWDEGAYGVVFADRAAGRVRKVFRRLLDEDHVRAVFNSEIGAYAIATAYPLLVNLIPGGFQRCAAQQIIDSADQDVSKEFFPDLAFEMAFIDGTFQKVGTVIGGDAWRVRQLFHHEGIRHTNDMSVVLAVDGCIQKAIDFAVCEVGDARPVSAFDLCTPGKLLEIYSETPGVRRAK